MTVVVRIMFRLKLWPPRICGLLLLPKHPPNDKGHERKLDFDPRSVGDVGTCIFRADIITPGAVNYDSREDLGRRAKAGLVPLLG